LPAGTLCAPARHACLAELFTLWTAVETAFVELWPALETALEMLFPALPADVHACSATDRALESEIDLAASLHLETALLEFELELPHPAATRPQTTSSATDPLIRPILNSSDRGRREPTRWRECRSNLRSGSGVWIDSAVSTDEGSPAWRWSTARVSSGRSRRRKRSRSAGTAAPPAGCSRSPSACSARPAPTGA